MNGSRLSATVIMMFALGLHILAEPGPKNDEPGIRNAESGTSFKHIDVFVDSFEKPLAAYQFEILVKEGDARIVGVEGGDHPAFKEAPYYDPEALKSGRIIIAAFHTGKDLPDGRTRVARVHLFVMSKVKPEITVKPLAFATGAGEKFSANVIIASSKGGKE
ncbi:MAG: hypothetical protein QF437_22660 [Planctomycetota bacterium]|jgi:hypothetical protein|nr:hypothetical protein [Planctomycetota bacterium]MDP7133315.1 hypothetical protein [Planctomycetota bacterium]MDP7253211.1 hypothetical protein [Planctomycetota bacterium]